MTDVFETMQIYLGSLYVNDFNKFGRTYSVRVQADAPVPRARRGHRPAEGALDARRDGAALGAAEGASRAPGPERAMRYNGFLAADINGGAGAGLLVRPGAGRGRAHRGRDAAERASASNGPS